MLLRRRLSIDGCWWCCLPSPPLSFDGPIKISIASIRLQEFFSILVFFSSDKFYHKFDCASRNFVCLSHYCLCLYVFINFLQTSTVSVLFGDENLWNILCFTWFCCFFNLFRFGWFTKEIHNTHSGKENYKQTRVELKTKTVNDFSCAGDHCFDLCLFWGSFKIFLP